MQKKAYNLNEYLLYDELNELKNNIEHEISYEFALKDLNITYEDYIKILYNEFSIYSVIEVFHKDNLWILAEILKYFNNKKLLNLMKKSGYYFENQDFMEWLEYFISISLNILNEHKVQLDTLQISLSGCQNPYDGFLFYCDLNNIDEEFFLKKSIPIFLNNRKIKPNAYNNYLLKKYIENCISNKIFSMDMIYHEFFNKLYQISIENNFIFEEKNNNHYQQKATNIYLENIGLKKFPSTKEELRKIYLQELKKYHPDINPEGLEKTKQIIEAYTKLLTYYE